MREITEIESLNCCLHPDGSALSHCFEMCDWGCCFCRVGWTVCMFNKRARSNTREAAQHFVLSTGVLHKPEMPVECVEVREGRIRARRRSVCSAGGRIAKGARTRDVDARTCLRTTARCAWLSTCVRLQLLTWQLQEGSILICVF